MANKFFQALEMAGRSIADPERFAEDEYSKKKEKRVLSQDKELAQFKAGLNKENFAEKLMQLKQTEEMKAQVKQEYNTGSPKQRIAFVNDDGDTEIGVFDPDTGAFTDAKGESLSTNLLKGFSDKIVTDTTTGQQAVFDQRNQTLTPINASSNSKGFNIKQSKDIQEAYANIAKDPLYIKSRDKLATVNEIKELLSGDTEGKQGFIFRTLLRMSGEQRFTEADIQQIKGSPSFKARAMAAYEEIMSGKITPANIAIFEETMNILEKSSHENLKGTVYARMSDLNNTSGLSEEDINRLIEDKISRELQSLPGSSEQNNKLQSVDDLIAYALSKTGGQ